MYLRKVLRQTHSRHSEVGLVHEGTRYASVETSVVNDGDKKVRVEGKDHCAAGFIHARGGGVCFALMATTPLWPFRFKQEIKWLWLEREKHAWPSWMVWM